MRLEEAVSGQPLIWGNRVGLLKDGPQAYSAMISSLKSAKRSVNLESYIFENDEVGRRFTDCLSRKQARGIQVNIILDSVGSFGLTGNLFDELLEYGGRIKEFRPVYPFHLIYLWGLNERDHRKIIVVDGRVGFTGGMNISDVYSGGSRSRGRRQEVGLANGWRDTHIQIMGPAVKALQHLFVQTWKGQGGESLVGVDYFPPLYNHGDRLVRVIGSRPGEKKRPIYLTYLSAVRNARLSVHISMAYFVPDRQMLEALCAAAARGVDVKLLLPSFSDARLALYAGKSYYGFLLKRGVKIYERKGSFMHAKTAVIDGVWSAVGTANMDFRSFLHNSEVIVVVYGSGFGKEMEQMFREDLLASEAITLKKWRHRSFSQRALGWVGRLIKYWL
jgi:cardiolipin synthase